MRRTMPIDMLPTDIRVEDAVEAACAQDIAYMEERLRRGYSVLCECDKELSLYLFMGIRQRLRSDQDAPRLVIVDGRPRKIHTLFQTSTPGIPPVAARAWSRSFSYAGRSTTWPVPRFARSASSFRTSVGELFPTSSRRTVTR